MSKRGKISDSSLDLYQPKRTASRVRDLKLDVKLSHDNQNKMSDLEDSKGHLQPRCFLQESITVNSTW